MRKITLIFPYYNNAEMFKFQWDYLRGYSKAIRDNLEVVVVDDGSTHSPLILPDSSDIKRQFFRTLVDVPWNIPFSRNLGATKATNNWIILTDIDHLIPESTMELLMTAFDLDPSKVYTFNRRKATSLNPFLTEPAGKPHLNTFLLTKQLYEELGGDDERLSGYYAAQETDFRNRAGSRLTPLEVENIFVGGSLIPDARTNGLPRKEAPDHLERRAIADAMVKRRDAGEIQFLRLTFPYTELKSDGIAVGATPDNTAVVTILAYENPSQIPIGFGFLQETARRCGITIIPLLQGKKYVFNEKQIDRSFENKITNFWPEVNALDEKYKYVLYIDARDTVIVQGLQAICDKFNKIGWPIVMGASRKCTHHVDPAWQARFGKHKGNFDFLNAGMWMAERAALGLAIERLKQLQPLVRDGITASSHPPLWNNDQHMWQTGYVEHAFPIRPDYNNEIFNNFHQCTIDDYDLSKSTPCVPISMKNGSEPCVIHFAGTVVTAMPFFVWCLNLVEPGVIPQVKV